MLDSLQNLFLVLNVINVLALDDLRLLHALDGILIARLGLEPTYAYVSECTYIKFGSLLILFELFV